MNNNLLHFYFPYFLLFSQAVIVVALWGVNERKGLVRRVLSSLKNANY